MIKSIMKKIELFEIQLKDEFGQKIFKSKGRANNVLNEFESFVKEKGLNNGKCKRKSKSNVHK
jgi:hypothetical protein